MVWELAFGRQGAIRGPYDGKHSTKETKTMRTTQTQINATTELKGLHIEGRRWFQRTWGNTYHSVRIFANGEQLTCLPYQYGYGDCFLQTAIDWLKAQGLIDHEAEYGTLYLRETLHGTYSVIDVERKKDL